MADCQTPVSAQRGIHVVVPGSQAGFSVPFVDWRDTFWAAPRLSLAGLRADFSLATSLPEAPPMWNNLEWNLGWRDGVDVAVVAVFVYYILLIIRRTSAVQILLGIVVLLVLQAVSFYLRLQATYFLLRGLVLSIVVALPIVFQPELRRALMQLGARSWKSPFHLSHDVLARVIDEIVWAVDILAQTRTGALIVVERETGLEEYSQRGVPISAEVSAKLLMSIFQKTSPLHDGAVVIRGDKVMWASVYLPLSEQRLPAANPHSGTRHRAALGLSEQTDAIIVVVSEETGEVSIATDARFDYNIAPATLKERLLSLLSVSSHNLPGNVSLVGFQRLVKPWLRPDRSIEPKSDAGAPRGRASTASASTADIAQTVRVEAWPPRVQGTAEVKVRAREVAPTPPTVPVEDIAEKQRQTEKAVEKRAIEARRREIERMREDESRKPESDELSASRDGAVLSTQRDDGVKSAGPSRNSEPPASVEALPTFRSSGEPEFGRAAESLFEGGPVREVSSPAARDAGGSRRHRRGDWLRLRRPGKGRR